MTKSCNIQRPVMQDTNMALHNVGDDAGFRVVFVSAVAAVVVAAV